MKAVILARISSKEQQDGHSLDAQTRNLELYARRKNLDIIRTSTLIESSTKRERLEFNQMIAFLKGRPEGVFYSSEGLIFKIGYIYGIVFRSESISLSRGNT
jgi:DNA invertase Pin-like site-specific DNA recombinase